MERDPYDTSINWMQQSSARSQEADLSNSSPEQQGIANRQEETTYPAYALPATQAPASAPPQVAPPKQAKKKPNMPKQKALALVSALKKGILVSSVVSFGFFGLLSANHLVNTTSSQTVASPSSSSSSSTTKSSSSSSTTSSSGGSSLSQQNGGYGFGSGSSSSQSSVSGTGVS